MYIHIYKYIYTLGPWLTRPWLTSVTSKFTLDNEHDNERCITSNFLDIFSLDYKLFNEQFSWWASKMLVRPTYYRENIKYLEICGTPTIHQCYHIDVMEMIPCVIKTNFHGSKMSQFVIDSGLNFWKWTEILFAVRGRHSLLLPKATTIRSLQYSH